jgi:hypothetical protein
MSQDYSSELFLLNKHLKKLFPFILDVSDVEVFTRRKVTVLYLDVYVSPEHYCELLDERILNKITSQIKLKSVKILYNLYPEIVGDYSLVVRFFPNVPEETSITKYLE